MVDNPVDLSRVRLVLFDLDGTLVDSVPDLTRAAAEMLRVLDRAAVSEAQVRHWVGDGITQLVERTLSLTGEEAVVDGAPLRRAETLFREAYAAHLSERSTAYPGAVETLESLRRRGLGLACVTNKDTRLARRLLRDLALYDRLDLTLGGDRVGRYKPDPGLLLHVMRGFDAAPSRTLMVGDSTADVAAARAAGAPVVAVSYGYNRGRDMAGENPDRVIDTLSELSGLLTRTG